MEQALTAMMGGLSPATFAAAVAITLFSGFVKGAIGFAMPLIMISGFAALMPPPVALAALILPMVATNLQQAFRQGPRAAWESVVKYRRLTAMLVLFILFSAQFVLVIPGWAMLGVLGLSITAYAAVQLAGRDLTLQLRHRVGAEYGLGILGGLYGGISGIWGPPVIVYMVSIGAEKREMVRVLGVTFLIGAVTLAAAHLRSGVLNVTTLPLSAAMVLPAYLGMWLGFRLQDRLDPLRFRRWTLVLLTVTGLNLILQATGG
jgi:uncharacterized membrane protein YfcA